MASATPIIQTIVSEDKRGRVIDYYTIGVVACTLRKPAGRDHGACVRRALDCDPERATVILGRGVVHHSPARVRTASTQSNREMGILPVEVVSGMTPAAQAE